MSELDKVIDQIESHAALYREQRLRAEIARLRNALEYIQHLPLGDEVDIARRAARRALEGK